MTENSAVERQLQAMLEAGSRTPAQVEPWEETGAPDPDGVRWFGPGPGQQGVLEFPDS